MSGGLTYLHDWQYNAVVGQYQRWSKSRNFWILKDPTTNKETSMNADMSEPEWPDDMTAILSIQNAPINMRQRDQGKYINTSGANNNCPWVTLATLKADGTRKSTQEIYDYLNSTGLVVVDGPANRKQIEDAATKLGNAKFVDVKCKWGDIEKAAGLPQKKTFGMWVLPPTGQGMAHVLTGWVDKGWTMPYDFQMKDVGEDMRVWIQGRWVWFVFWFED